MIATTFDVTVSDVIMGNIEPRAIFVQYGGVRGRTTWVTEDQETLTPGGTYLLAGGRGEHGYQVIGGPVAVQRLDTVAAQQRAASEWREHVANRRTPRVNR
ncbi:hypothetical protein [Microlunatus sp. Y2014]|uniref:hypothetical protein n=1 Tax=Microlunatus sp. Y2014 TaxID=3418488 RepID=UPI003DA742C7